MFDVNKFIQAGIDGNTDEIRKQLNDECSHVDAVQAVHRRTFDNRTALIYAAWHNRIETVACLINAGANVNHADISGETSLHRAAVCGNGEIVTLLLKAGAKINVTNKDKITPLLFAAEYGHTAIVRELLDAGAKIEMVDNEKRTILQRSVVAMSNAETIKLLLARGANPYIPFANGFNRGLTVFDTSEYFPKMREILVAYHQKQIKSTLYLALTFDNRLEISNTIGTSGIGLFNRSRYSDINLIKLVTDCINNDIPVPELDTSSRSLSAGS